MQVEWLVLTHFHLTKSDTIKTKQKKNPVLDCLFIFLRFWKDFLDNFP